MHGGRIVASSPGEGCGSRFAVWLPTLVGSAAPAERAPQPKAALVGRGGPSWRVLVVDDNVDSADAMGELARAAGHVVEVAYGPLQALARVAEFRPQVALLDPRSTGHGRLPARVLTPRARGRRAADPDCTFRIWPGAR